MHGTRTIPLSSVEGHNGCTLRLEAQGLVLLTPSQRWAFAAEVVLDWSDAQPGPRIVIARVEVQSGVLGVGWLQPDGSGWVTRGSAHATGGETAVTLVVPAEPKRGCLIFENRTEGGDPCHAIVKRIDVVDADPRSYYEAGLSAEESGDQVRATEQYQAALQLDPSFVEAIAGLGRLRFLPPHQPLIDQIKQRAPLGDICHVLVEIRNPCNYRCFYCSAKGANNVPVQRFDLAAVDRTYDAITGRLIVTGFACGGGEPTVHPQFPDLLRICSRRGAVSIPTNNSQDPERWLPKETARRIAIAAALHPEGEPHADRFVKYGRYLLDAGCNFSAIYISHPTRIANLPKYRDLFAKHNVPFVPIPFNGQYEGRSYPHAFTEDEKELIGLKEQPRSWYDRIQPHATRIRNFRGIPCTAGQRSLYILADGSLRRCPDDLARPLSAPLHSAEPCGVKNCGCGLFLDRLNSFETVQFYNGWGSMVGLEPIETGWIGDAANSLGYAGVEDALLAENIRMYDVLMAAFGKDEFPEP